MKKPILDFQYLNNINIGPSGVRAPAVSTQVATIGPSGAVQTVSDSRRPLF